MENYSELISTNADIATEYLDQQSNEPEDIIPALEAVGELEKLVKELKSLVNAKAMDSIPATVIDACGKHVTRIHYKPTPVITEDQMATLRIDNPELFNTIADAGEELDPDTKQELIDENDRLTQRAIEVNDRLHKDELYLHPEIRPEFSAGNGVLNLQNILEGAGYGDIVSGWKQRADVLRMTKSKK